MVAVQVVDAGGVVGVQMFGTAPAVSQAPVIQPASTRAPSTQPSLIAAIYAPSQGVALPSPATAAPLMLWVFASTSLAGATNRNIKKKKLSNPLMFSLPIDVRERVVETHLAGGNLRFGLAAQI